MYVKRLPCDLTPRLSLNLRRCCTQCIRLKLACQAGDTHVTLAGGIDVLQGLQAAYFQDPAVIVHLLLGTDNVPLSNALPLGHCKSMRSCLQCLSIACALAVRSNDCKVDMLSEVRCPNKLASVSGSPCWLLLAWHSVPHQALLAPVRGTRGMQLHVQAVQGAAW